MANQTHNKSAGANDLAAARLDRKAVTNPVLARGWQMGIALVDAALRDQTTVCANAILAATAKLR